MQRGKRIARVMLAVTLSACAGADDRTPPAPLPAAGYPVTATVEGDAREWRGTFEVSRTFDGGPLQFALSARQYDPVSDTVRSYGPFLEIALLARPSADGPLVLASGWEPLFTVPHSLTLEGGVLVSDILMADEITAADVEVDQTGLVTARLVIAGTYVEHPDRTAVVTVEFAGPAGCIGSEVDLAIDFADGTAGMMQCPSVLGAPLFVAE